MNPWGVDALHGVGQSHVGLVVLVDHLHARLDDLGRRELLVRRDDGLDVVLQHDVVSAHDHRELVTDEGERLAVVAVGTEVLFVAQVGDP